MSLILPTGPESAPDQGLFNDTERKRMVTLGVVFVMVTGMFAYSFLKDSRRTPTGPVEKDAVPVAVVVTPEVDVARLEELARDAAPGDRVIIEEAALDAILEPARILGDAHFEPMGGRVLDGEGAAAILEDPSAARGDLFRLRGWIESIRPFDAGPGTTAHYRGRLRLEDDARVWFAILALPESAGNEGDFVRMDGLFLKVLKQDGLEAPLFVGPRAVASFERLDPVAELDLKAFSFVRDDTASDISGQPFYEYWRLVSYVEQLDGDSIDWSEAPLLDGEKIVEVYADGGPWRAAPFRIPPSEVMAIWNKAQPENPIRIERMTEGWAGNWEWGRSTQGLIRFVAPFENELLSRNDGFTARGFFLKNLAYEPAKGGVATVPFFVLHSFEKFEASQGEGWTTVLWIVSGSLVALLGLLSVGVMRDRRKAAALQLELRRRRQARREAAPQQT